MLSRAEKRDLIDLLLCAGTVGIVWLLWGARPGFQISRQDGLEFFYAALHVIREAGQGLDGPVYDPAWLGGAKFAAPWAMPWFTKLFLLSGLSLTNVISLSLVVPQICHGFLSLKLMDGILAWRKTDPCHLLWERWAWVLLFCFPPFLAWRIGGGHLYHPSLLPLAAAALLLGMRTRCFGGIGFFLCGLILFTCLDSKSYPQYMNDLLIGLPLLGFLLWQIRPWPREEFVLFALLALGAGGWNLRGHLEAIHFYSGADFARQAGNSVYSFGIPGWRDWLNGLFWDGRAFPSPRAVNVLGEFNYAFGPLFLLFLLGIRASWRGLHLLCLALLALCLALASNFQPISTLLLAGIPKLNFFRVPARALFPLSTVLLPMAAASLSYFPQAWPRNKTIYLFPAAWLAALALTPDPFLRELMLMAGMLVLLSLQFGRTILLFTLAGFSLLAFFQRMPAPLDLRLSETKIATLREAILAKAPALQNPLERARLEFKDEKFVANTGRLLGLSTLDGYWMPSPRFNNFVFETYGLPVMELAMNFHLPQQPATERIYSLYNVTHEIRMDPAGPDVQKIRESERVKLRDPAHPGQPCSNRHIETTEVQRFFKARVKVSAGAPCVLILATNYVEGFRALIPAGELPVFPVGPLVGVGLGPDASTVEISVFSKFPSWLKISALLSFLILLVASARYRKAMA